MYNTAKQKTLLIFFYSTYYLLSLASTLQCLFIFQHKKNHCIVKMKKLHGNHQVVIICSISYVQNRGEKVLYNFALQRRRKNSKQATSHKVQATQQNELLMLIILVQRAIELHRMMYMKFFTLLFFCTCYVVAKVLLISTRNISQDILESLHLIVLQRLHFFYIPFFFLLYCMYLFIFCTLQSSSFLHI